mmetsp:Transcript_17569/g.54758  ORF Transcript_17569/g.54758 Transcript_17569/m.54758 type:complete len:205 (-) Transcript_17569:1876-2490(-)
MSSSETAPPASLPRPSKARRWGAPLVLASRSSSESSSELPPPPPPSSSLSRSSSLSEPLSSPSSAYSLIQMSACLFTVRKRERWARVSPDISSARAVIANSTSRLLSILSSAACVWALAVCWISRFNRYMLSCVHRPYASESLGSWAKRSGSVAPHCITRRPAILGAASSASSRGGRFQRSSTCTSAREATRRCVHVSEPERTA